MSLKLYIGLLTFSLSLSSILLNCVVLAPVFHLAFISKKSSVYVIAFFNIVSDLVQLSGTCFVLSTSIIADRYLLTGDRSSAASIFCGFIFINAWFMECIVQILMATNRYAVITLEKSNIFTFKSTLWMFAIAISISTFSAYCVQYMLPCCAFIVDHSVLSYVPVLIKGIYPYSNVMRTLVSIFCYGSVFLTIRKTRQKVANNVQNAKANQDFRYLLQFVFISIFYVFTWTFFEALNHVTLDVPVESWCVVPIFQTINCSSNAIIYLSVNPEVQKLIPCLRKKGIYASASNQVAPAPTIDN